MTILIQRGRQFDVGGAPVFDEQGRAGGYLAKAAEKLIAQEIKVTIGGKVLATTDEWKAFIAANASTARRSEGFVTKFGIAFQDFVNIIDDVAASDEKKFNLDLTATGTVATKLSLNRSKDDYAAQVAKGGEVELGAGPSGPVKATAAGVNTITKDILSTPIVDDYQRDRLENEAWADFEIGNGAAGRFRDNTGPAPFAKMYQPKWADPEAMALTSRFTLPLHLEVDGSPNTTRQPGLVIPDPAFPDDRSKDQKIYFQDGYENFRDTYYDDHTGTLDKAGSSVRVRVRFDNKPPNFAQKDVRIQAKDGRVIAGTDSAVHKYEVRGLSAEGEDEAMAMLTSGKRSPTEVLTVAQKLYKHAQESGSLPADGNLTLAPKYTVLQKRRRTHMQLDDLRTLEARAEAMKKEVADLTAASKPVPAALTAYAAKVDAQIKFFKDASGMLSKYGGGGISTWGDIFIISADRYNVYDATARKTKINDLENEADQAGLIGKGPLHVEAEWDSASSDSFENAGKEIKRQLEEARTTLASTPATSTDARLALEATIKVLEADATGLASMIATFRKDVNTTVAIMRERLVAAGLREDAQKLSKDERAGAIAKDTKRAVYWP